MRIEDTAKLRERIEELEEEVRQLKAERGIAESAAEIGRAMKAFRLERMQARYLLAFARHCFLRANWFGEQLHPESVDPWACAKVQIVKLRNKLKPHGIRIETVWGEGYSITPADREKIIAILHDEGRLDHAA